MIIFSIIFYFIVICLLCVIIWKLHLRVEDLAEKMSLLSMKVKDGEEVVIENFQIIEKRFTKLDHEIKEINISENKIKEVFKAFSRINRDGGKQ